MVELTEIWHYSFNSCFKTRLRTIGRIGYRFRIYEPLNEFSPAKWFNSELPLRTPKGYNVIIAPYNRNIRSQRKVFWFLALRGCDFEEFLLRKTESSSKPNKHYPSLQTYKALKDKLAYHVEITGHDEDFVSQYDRMKPPSYKSGAEKVDSLLENNIGLPIQWLKIFRLYVGEELVSMALIIDDGRSVSLQIPISKRSSYGYGNILNTEIIRYCCENKYYSFDAGVSGVFGVYKEKVFLDSFEIAQRKFTIDYILRKVRRFRYK